MEPRKITITIETFTDAPLAELRALRGKTLWPSPAVYGQSAIRAEQIQVNVIRPAKKTTK